MKTTADKQTLKAMSQKYIEGCSQTQTVDKWQLAKQWDLKTVAVISEVMRNKLKSGRLTNIGRIENVKYMSASRSISNKHLSQMSSSDSSKCVSAPNCFLI